MRFDTSGNNCRFLDQEQARKTIWCRGNSDDGRSPVLRYVSGKLLATELPDRRYRITNTFVSFYKYTTVMSYLIPTNRKESWLLFWNPRIVIPQPFSSLRRFIGMAANPLHFSGQKAIILWTWRPRANAPAPPAHFCRSLGSSGLANRLAA